MKRSFLGLALLLLGMFLSPYSREETASAWWPDPLIASAAKEAQFSVLGVPTGPVGAVAIDPLHPSTLYMGGSQGLFRSTDGGASWALLSQELRYPHTLLVDPSDSTRLYAARRDVASFLPLPGIYRSTDGGLTWHRFAVSPDDDRIFALAVDPLHHGTLYAGSWAGLVFKSTDGGERWTRPSPEPVRRCAQCAAGTVGQLLVNPLDGAVYALESYAGTFRSDDGGAHWTQVNGEGSCMAIDPMRGTLYLAGRRLQSSGDGGKTWADLSAGLPYDPQTGAYATYWIAVSADPPVLYTRYHRSTDGGATWQRLQAPAAFLPRLLVPAQQVDNAGQVSIYGSMNGQAGRYDETVIETP